MLCVVVGYFWSVVEYTATAISDYYNNVTCKVPIIILLYTTSFRNR